MNEIWKDISGYEGLYQISNRGRVKSLGRVVSRGQKGERFEKEIILKQVDNTHGYLAVSLSKDGKAKTVRVQRLVAEAFIPNPNELPFVNHIDEVKHNNEVENLEWVTPKENSNHGTMPERISKMKSMPVVGTNIKTGEKVKFPSVRSTKEAGFMPQHVSKVANGKRKTHKGCTWTFAVKVEELEE